MENEILHLRFASVQNDRGKDTLAQNDEMQNRKGDNRATRRLPLRDNGLVMGNLPVAPTRW